MISFRKRLMAVLAAADDIGSDDCQMGDVIQMMSNILDAHPLHNGIRLGRLVDAEVEKAEMMFNHPAASQLLVDIHDAWINYKIDLAQIKKAK